MDKIVIKAADSDLQNPGLVLIKLVEVLDICQIIYARWTLPKGVWIFFIVEINCSRTPRLSIVGPLAQIRRLNEMILLAIAGCARNPITAPVSPKLTVL